MTQELKPCPFCGGTDVGWDLRGEYYGQYAFFGCNDCGAGFDDADEGDRFHPSDVAAWNRRADLPPPTLAQALEVPEIATLVDAAQNLHDYGTVLAKPEYHRAMSAALAKVKP